MERDSHCIFLLEVLGAAVPSQHNAELTAIVRRTQNGWRVQATAIRELVVRTWQEEEGLIRTFHNNVNHIHQ